MNVTIYTDGAARGNRDPVDTGLFLNILIQRISCM